VLPLLVVIRSVQHYPMPISSCFRYLPSELWVCLSGFSTAKPCTAVTVETPQHNWGKFKFEMDRGGAGPP
jgi:hypothetical protein